MMLVLCWLLHASVKIAMLCLAAACFCLLIFPESDLHRGFFVVSALFFLPAMGVLLSCFVKWLFGLWNR